MIASSSAVWNRLLNNIKNVHLTKKSLKGPLISLAHTHFITVVISSIIISTLYMHAISCIFYVPCCYIILQYSTVILYNVCKVYYNT